MSAPVARTPRTPGGSVQGTRQQLDELDALLQRMLSLPVNHSEGTPAPDVATAEPPAEEEWNPPPPPAPRASTPAFAAHPPTPRPLPQSPHRSYPASYMVVETATPPFFDAPDAGLGPRKVADEPRPAAPPYSFPAVPGGRHQVAADTPNDPIAEAARAQLAMPDEGEWVPLQSSWQPSAQTWKPLAETWEQSRGSAPPRPTLPEPPMMPTWRENVIPPPPPGYEEMQRAEAARPQPEPVAAPPEPAPAPEGPGAPVAPPRSPLLLAPVVWFNKGFDLMLVPFGPAGRWFAGPSGRTALGTVGLLCLTGAVAWAVVERFGWTR